MTCEDCIHYDVCKEDNLALAGHTLVESTAEVCDNFKDKSKYIELPCKVGDKIWLAHNCYGSKWVDNYNILKVGITVKGMLADVGYDFKDIGETVFLTREEAENALKERENNA